MIRLRATGKKALHLRYLVEDFFGEVMMSDGEADFSLEKDLFTDYRKDPPYQFTVSSDSYLVSIHKYFSEEKEDLGGWGIMHGVRPLKWIHVRREEGWTTRAIQQDLLENGRLREDKLDLLFEVEANQKTFFEADRDKLSLYISLPFCPTICHFCCFHSVPYTKRLSELYLSQLYEDLALLREKIQENNKTVDIVYLGGGTPSSLCTEQLSALLEQIERYFPKDSLKEYTIEAGRIDSFTEEKAELIAQFATRVCINPQTFSEEVLQTVGRPSALEMKKWVHYFKEKGLLINADLIAGLPGESLQQFLHSLERLIELEPENITIHQLSKKKGSKLMEDLQDNPSAGEMTTRAYQRLKDANFHPYYLYRQKKMVDRGENIGYAKKGTECLYNIRMMEDQHEVVAAGSNSVLKKIRGGKLTRLTNYRDVRVFLSNPERYGEHLQAFFADNDARDEGE